MEEGQYLGEYPHATIGGVEAALLYIEMYGQVDGAHHKQWVLDQVARILLGTPVIVTIAKWSNGHQEKRYDLGEPTSAYTEWVKKMCDGEDGPKTYSYDEGVAP